MKKKWIYVFYVFLFGFMTAMIITTLVFTSVLDETREAIERLVPETVQETEAETTAADKPVTEPTVKPLVAKQEYVDIGECKITYYCCERRRHICGTGDGLTSTLTEVREGVVAVDPDVIPLGSKVLINGVWYTAEDTGKSIKGNRIDIAVKTHNEALEKGVIYADVRHAK